MQADYEIEPWGWLNMEILVAHLRRDIHWYGSHGKANPAISELMPVNGRPKDTPTEDELAAKVGALLGNG